MMINEPNKAPRNKELKVNIPIRYHLKLHELKVVEGAQIRDVVEAALDKWFQKVAKQG